MSGNAAIGFIGLGMMGAPMAERLIGEGVTLHVFDPSPDASIPFRDAGCVVHDGPRGVADAAACVFACLPKAAISESVAAEVAEGAAVRVHVEMSTIGRATVERIAARLAARGIGFVDSPVTGGPARVRAGALAVMTAGAPAAVEQALPWLSRIARTVFRVGDTPGLAQSMKLVNNLAVAATMATTFEALVYGARAGLDPAIMAEVLNAGTGRSFVTTDIVPRAVLTGSFDFGARLAILEKDVALGLSEAHALGVPMWANEQVARLYAFAASQGLAEADMSAVIRVMEGWAGTEVRARGG
ncbi:NAD(P)-dependent oxidoreductase [Roseomonas sp. NAR14]|uniref:NAD(P)-dependent oxidoreductase n=1 Tax=Roseomonas acroporae TaxID=2937791 RepID=A0A9X1Y741_9PROT|nr:NAD(P)-dependent oxidoreductase [Roseomonas acroporae]MCK8783287.1 NAD(P)-dependent oxidoreductase [Roseomonas acroporae]